MDMNRLKKRLIEFNKGNEVIGLICQPTEEQREALSKGSGNPDSEMEQVNSSAGLAVNYWRAYELCHPDSSVEFEWKKQKPLKRGIPANIDVVVREKDRMAFIESKFLEPYYSRNAPLAKSYVEPDKYSEETGPAEPWVELFSEAKNFKIYNVVQLCRHLLAIYKDMMITPEDYVQKTVTLLSVTWGMTDAFLNDYFTDKEKAGLAERTKRISEESARCHKLLNDFISNTLGVGNLRFDVKKYNDIIGLVSEFPEYEKLRKQYFL